jgi:hypothetical protein
MTISLCGNSMHPYKMGFDIPSKGGDVKTGHARFEDAYHEE